MFDMCISCAVPPKLRGIVCDLHQLLQGVCNSARRTEIFTEWAAQVNVNVRFASSALIMVTFLLHFEQLLQYPENGLHDSHMQSVVE